jgi:hypothetical protein
MIYIFFFNLFYRWENVRLDLYIFEYLFINKVFEMKNISLNDIFFLTYFIDGKTFVWISLILDDTFFLSLFYRGENISISSIWVVTKSYLRGIDEGDRTIAHP